MVLKVLPLKSRSRGAIYDAVLFVNDKALVDEVERVFDKMLSNRTDAAREDLGLVKLLIRPRVRGDRSDWTQ